MDSNFCQESSLAPLAFSHYDLFVLLISLHNYNLLLLTEIRNSDPFLLEDESNDNQTPLFMETRTESNQDNLA